MMSFVTVPGVALSKKSSRFPEVRATTGSARDEVVSRTATPQTDRMIFLMVFDFMDDVFIIRRRPAFRMQFNVRRSVDRVQFDLCS